MNSAKSVLESFAVWPHYYCDIGYITQESIDAAWPSLGDHFQPQGKPLKVDFILPDVLLVYSAYLTKDNLIYSSMTDDKVVRVADWVVKVDDKCYEMESLTDDDDPDLSLALTAAILPIHMALSQREAWVLKNIN